MTDGSASWHAGPASSPRLILMVPCTHTASYSRRAGPCMCHVAATHPLPYMPIPPKAKAGGSCVHVHTRVRSLRALHTHSVLQTPLDDPMSGGDAGLSKCMQHQHEQHPPSKMCHTRSHPPSKVCHTRSKVCHTRWHTPSKVYHTRSKMCRTKPQQPRP